MQHIPRLYQNTIYIVKGRFRSGRKKHPVPACFIIMPHVYHTPLLTLRKAAVEKHQSAGMKACIVVSSLEFNFESVAGHESVCIHFSMRIILMRFSS
jgi:hypothetical protein